MRQRRAAKRLARRGATKPVLFGSDVVVQSLDGMCLLWTPISRQTEYYVRFWLVRKSMQPRCAGGLQVRLLPHCCTSAAIIASAHQSFIVLSKDSSPTCISHSQHAHLCSSPAGLRRSARAVDAGAAAQQNIHCLLYTSPSPRDRQKSRMPSSA